jgi:hypothetical protein
MNDNNYDGCKGCTQYNQYKKYSGDISLTLCASEVFPENCPCKDCLLKPICIDGCDEFFTYEDSCYIDPSIEDLKDHIQG